MILLNFSHPLTPDHRQQIETIAGHKIERVVEIPSQIDLQQPLVPQVVALADQAGLSPAEWQTLPLLVNPPALNFIAVVLLAELHGRCGYFPTHLRMRPVPDSIPPSYGVAEVINLQAARDAARTRRQASMRRRTTENRSSGRFGRWKKRLRDKEEEPNELV